MNAKATQWLRLAAWLRQRGEPSSRSSRSPESADEIKKRLLDPEVSGFLRSRQETFTDLASVRQTEIEAVYQAVLADPKAEEEILQSTGFQDDPKRLEQMHTWAASYVRRLEEESQKEKAYRQTAQGSKLRRVVQALFLLCLLSAAGVGTWAYLTLREMKAFLFQPAGVTAAPVDVVIERGSDTEAVAQKLRIAGLIQSETLFFRFARFFKIWKQVIPELKTLPDVRFRAGEYKLSPSLTPLQILALLHKGPPRETIRITIPEGFNLWKIAARLERQEICPSKDFVAVARDPQIAKRLLGWDAPSLEGYLYPDTYRLYKGMKAILVAETMIQRFLHLFQKNVAAPAKQMGWTPHQVATLASIIEKETGKGHERPMISKVFHNRLKRGWKLETDPTVIYGLLPDFNGNLTQRDLHNPHPYNTYKHHGLPPGPIASAGIAALKAAVDPQSQRACVIFFVSRNDGSHVFSCTKKEHERWVDVYQRKILPPPRPSESP